MNRYLEETVGEVSKGDLRLPVVRGWSGVLARLLVEQSKQPEILRWTPRDSTERFATYAHAQRWYEDIDKSPVIYSLGLTEIYLPGMAWFSKRKHHLVPTADLTFGIRLYEGFAGRGLSTPFAQAVHDDMDRLYPQNVWLETEKDNHSARRLYENLGYVAVGESQENRIVMARQASDLL